MQLLRRREVVARTGLSYPTIYRYELRGEFPARRRIGPNSVGWLAHEVDEWIKSRSVVRSTRVDNAPSSQSIQSPDSA
jgi:prophage regulatory protein